MSIDGLLFDIDGVVIDSEIAKDAVNRDFISERATKNAPYDRDRYKPLMAGKPSLEGMRILKGAYGLTGDVVQLNKERNEMFNTQLLSTVPLVPGFIEFYRALRQAYHVPVAAPTGMDPEQLQLVDSRLHVQDLLDGHIYPSSIIGVHKPNPAIVVYVAEKIGVDPVHCLYFEDAPNGIAAGMRAGAHVVALTRTFSKKVLQERTEDIMGEHMDASRVLYISAFTPDSLNAVVSWSKREE